MLNGGGAGRLVSWQYKGRDEVMCVFLAEHEAHRAELKYMISRVNEIDRVLGHDIGFLILFPLHEDDKRSECSDFVFFKNIISSYDAEHVSNGHMSTDIMDEIRKEFDVDFTSLPVLLLFTRGFPETPFILECPKDITADDLLIFFRNLRGIVESSKKLSDEEIKLPPPSELEKILSKARALDAVINDKQKKYVNVLTDFANRHHFDRDQQARLAFLDSGNSSLALRLSAALARIEAELNGLARAEREIAHFQRQVKQLEKLAAELDAFREAQADIVRAGVSTETLDEMVASQMRKSQRILDELQLMKLKKNAMKRGKAVAGMLKGYNTWETHIEKIVSLTKLARKFLTFGV